MTMCESDKMYAIYKYDKQVKAFRSSGVEEEVHLGFFVFLLLYIYSLAPSCGQKKGILV